MRKRVAYHCFALLFVLALAACASSSGSTRGTTGAITAEQLDNLGPGVTAYEAIERLRPIWLRDRGINSPSAAYVLSLIHI